MPKDQVLIDDHQDWELLQSEQSDTFTTFKFKRPITLSNDQDRSILVRRILIIWFFFKTFQVFI